MATIIAAGFAAGLAARVCDKVARINLFKDFAEKANHAIETQMKYVIETPPGKPLTMEQKLTLLILQRQAMTADCKTPPDALNVDDFGKGHADLVRAMQAIEQDIKIKFDADKLKYEDEEEIGEDDEESEKGDEQHENGAICKFMDAYSKARRAYFTAVYGCSPWRGISGKTLNQLQEDFQKASDLYDKIPEGIRSNLRNQTITGVASLEIKEYCALINEWRND